MSTIRMHSLFLLGLFFFAATTVWQSDAVADIENSTLTVCVGADVVFPWTFSFPADKMAPPEVSWTTEGTAESPSVTLATYSRRDLRFSASPVYRQRLNLSEDGERMTLRGVTTQDSGNYLLVTVPDKMNERESALGPRVLWNVSLTIDGLSSSDGDLHVYIEDRAFRDSDSNRWMVSLSCGNFSFSHNNPPVDVTWITPSGETLNSSHGFSHGQFHLHLVPPFLEGRYTCRLPQDRFAAGCIPPGGCSQGDGKLEDSVWLEQLLARLLVVEADQQVLLAENTELKVNQASLKEAVETKTEEVQSLREEMRALRQEVMTRHSQEARELEGRVRTEILRNLNQQPLAVLRDRIDHLSLNVAFMAQMGQDVTLGSSQRVKLNSVHYNAGGAYQPSSGEFTAPVAGTYHFFMKTESQRNKAVFLSMKKEGQRVLYLHAQDRNAYHTPAGSVVLHLATGQRVWVDTATWGSSNLVRTWTTFGGFLVRPDVTED